MAIITDIVVGYATAGGATDDAGAAAFGDEATERCPLADCLTSLDLSRNNLGPLGAAAVARMLSSPTGPHHLRRLGLSKTSIGPDGAAYLSAAMTASAGDPAYLNLGSGNFKTTQVDLPPAISDGLS